MVLCALGIRFLKNMLKLTRKGGEMHKIRCSRGQSVHESLITPQLVVLDHLPQARNRLSFSSPSGLEESQRDAGIIFRIEKLKGLYAEDRLQVTMVDGSIYELWEVS